MQADTDLYRQHTSAEDGFRHGILFRRGHPEVPYDPALLDQLVEEQIASWQTHHNQHELKIGLDEAQRYRREWQRGFQTSEEQDFPRPRRDGMTVNALPIAKLLLSGLCAVHFAPAQKMYRDHHTCVYWPEGTRFSIPYEVAHWQGPLVIDVLLPLAHQFPACCPYLLWEPEQVSIYGTTPPASNWDLLIGKSFPCYEETLDALRREKVYEEWNQRNALPCQQSGCYTVYSDEFRCTKCGVFACLEHRYSNLCIRCFDHWIELVSERGHLHQSSGLFLP